MNGFWEDMFRRIGLLWQFEPADSAIFARDLFVKNGIRKILIPGVGYGRNARIFLESGFDVTGIEISETAIQLARENGLEFPVRHGSVTQMPFDDSVYDGIYCYALIHLLNQNERRQFLKNCSDQIRGGGLMVFITASKGYTKLYENGKPVSKDRFRIQNGLEVFFYDSGSIEREFGKFGLIEYREIEEPVKHMPNEEPMKCWMVVCRKSNSSKDSESSDG
jgi:SAM-dependent methyltransferase